jgi:hypothetical protein
MSECGVGNMDVNIAVDCRPHWASSLSSVLDLKLSKVWDDSILTLYRISARVKLDAADILPITYSGHQFASLHLVHASNTHLTHITCVVINRRPLFDDIGPVLIRRI